MTPAAEAHMIAQGGGIMKDEQAIRRHLQEKFADHAEYRQKPGLGRMTGLQIGGGHAQPCFACDGLITEADAKTSVPYTYPSGQTIWFDSGCEKIWEDERHRPLAVGAVP
jgi:hypothetical protein